MSLPTCGRLIVCDALIGAPRVPFPRPPHVAAAFTPDVADLRAEMARLCIDAAVVRHRACLEAGPYFGNDLLMAEIAGYPDLIPAWFVTPDGREPDWDPQRVIDAMLDAGVRLAWLDPEAELMSLQPWCCGRLYAALQAYRMPLMLPYPTVKADDLHLILESYPRLPVILFNVLRLGRNRLLEPLLAQHPNLHLCFGPSFSVHAYFRDLCGRFGPERWVWGAGYPEFEGGAGVTGLTYAGLTEDALALVAHGNIERLLTAVAL
jgi:hypothetical protein